MSDTDPVHPRGAALGGRFIMAIGCLVCVLAVGIVVAQIVLGTFSIAGVVIAVIVAVAGGAAIAVGQGLTRSREH